MKKIRLLLAGAIVAGTVFVGAGPAQAYCQPDPGTGTEACPPCEAEKLNSVSRKLIGQDLFLCPM